MLSLLARLGSTTERDPALLLLRAGAPRAIGRVDEAAADIDRAVELAVDAAAAGAPARGDRVGPRPPDRGPPRRAERIVRDTLRELGEGEGQTLRPRPPGARRVRDDSDAREDLQRAAESYRVAAAAWESCSEFARARACRLDLALGVLAPLGRFDEALAQVEPAARARPTSPTPSAPGRCSSRGSCCCNANRLDSAELALRAHRRPRLPPRQPAADRRWRRGVGRSRRPAASDLPSTLRWIATAENTALGEADDVLGVPFLCDVADDARRARRARPGRARTSTGPLERDPVFTGQVLSTAFMLDARKGILGDSTRRSAHTAPDGVVAGQARRRLRAGRAGRPGRRARGWPTRPSRELVALGFSDFASLGEGATYLELQAALAARQPSRSRPRRGAVRRPPASAGAAARS